MYLDLYYMEGVLVVACEGRNKEKEKRKGERGFHFFIQ